MSAAVVADCASDIAGNRVQIADQLFDGLGFERRVTGDGVVEFGDIGVVVFAVVNLHGLVVDVRRQSVM